MAILETIVSILLLAFASERIVEGAVALSMRFGLPKVVVGVVILGYAAGLPELTASGIASLHNLGTVGLGSVIGSTTINATLVLGIGALIQPITIESKLIVREGIIALAATLLFASLALVGMRKVESLIEIVAFIAITTILVTTSGRSTEDELVTESEEFEKEETKKHRFLNLPPYIDLTLGIILMLIGAQILITGVEGLILEFHIQQGVAGALILATGATLPELLNSISAARREEGEILVGNVFGEIIFNSTIVGGFAGIFHPGILSHSMVIAPIPIMVVSVILALGFLLRGKVLGPIKATTLLIAYIGAVLAITFA